MTADPDPQTVALARAVERTGRRLDNVELLLRQLTADIAALGVRLDDTEAEPAVVRSWLVAEHVGHARDDLTELTDWLHDVYLRYHGARLPSCWLWHPAVVEELWWLYQAWTDAYTGRRASWTAVGDWHDRQRPGVVRRLLVAVGDCELGRHVPGGDRNHPAPVVPLTTASPDIASWWTEHRDQPPPEPTEQQLTEAQHHDNHRDHP